MQENSPKQIQNVVPEANSKDQSLALDTIANSLVRAYGKKSDTFSEMQSEIVQLENDLKYVTGAKNKAEILDRIMILKNKLAKSGEAKVIEKENEDNFESGMSFTASQKRSIEALHAVVSSENGKLALNGADVISLSFNLEDFKNNDIALKEAIDDFVKQYRSKRDSFPTSGYSSNYSELDHAVLDYEKAFGVKVKPLVDGSLLLEREKQQLVKEIQITVDAIKVREKWLLELKAKTRRGIFGVNKADKLSQKTIELDLAKEKEGLMLQVQSAMRDFVGINLQDIGFQYFLRK